MHGNSGKWMPIFPGPERGNVIPPRRTRGYFFGFVPVGDGSPIPAAQQNGTGNPSPTARNGHCGYRLYAYLNTVQPGSDNHVIARPKAVGPKGMPVVQSPLSIDTGTIQQEIPTSPSEIYCMIAAGNHSYPNRFATRNDKFVRFMLLLTKTVNHND